MTVCLLQICTNDCRNSHWKWGDVPLGILKKLNARDIGPYSHKEVWFKYLWAWDFLRVWNQPIFNVKDLVVYCTSVDHLAIICGPSSTTSTSPQPYLVHSPPSSPPPPRRHPIEEIDDMLEDEIISAADRGHQWYLVRWHQWSESVYTWL